MTEKHIDDPKIAAIVNRLNDRLIGAYGAISEAFKPGMETVAVTLTAGQCATILSSLSASYGEDISDMLERAEATR